MKRYEPTRRASPPRWKVRLKWAVITVCTLALILGGAGIYLFHRFEGNITQLDVTKSLGNRPQRTVEGTQRPLNVLVMGSDTRKGQGSEVKGSTPGLSDTTILLHVSADRSRAYGVSIPRDAMVERPTCTSKDGKRTVEGGLTQFNAAYAVGGPACTIKTVESLTDIYIDHFVVVDFNGFRRMVNALGGVQVCVPEEVNDETGDIHLAKGTYTVTGEQALDYVRVRHQLSSNGDIGRMKRQQTFVAAMISKAVSAGTLANPVRLVKFLDAATQSLTTDPGFARLKELADLGASLKNIGLDNVQFVTVPFQEYAPDPNRVELAPDADQLWRRIKNDKSLPSSVSDQVIKASDKTPGTKTTREARIRAKQRAAIEALVLTGTGKLKDLDPAAEQAAKDKATEERQALAANNGLCA